MYNSENVLDFKKETHTFFLCPNKAIRYIFITQSNQLYFLMTKTMLAYNLLCKLDIAYVNQLLKCQVECLSVLENRLVFHIKDSDIFARFSPSVKKQTLCSQASYNGEHHISNTGISMGAVKWIGITLKKWRWKMNLGLNNKFEDEK